MRYQVCRSLFQVTNLISLYCKLFFCLNHCYLFVATQTDLKLGDVVMDSVSVLYARQTRSYLVRQRPFLHINITSFHFYLAYYLYAFSYSLFEH